MSYPGWCVNVRAIREGRTLFSLVLLSFVAGLVVDLPSSSFWLNRRKTHDFHFMAQTTKTISFDIWQTLDIGTWSLASMPMRESPLVGILLLQRWMQKIPIRKLEGYTRLLGLLCLMILKQLVNPFGYSQSGWIYINKVNNEDTYPNNLGPNSYFKINCLELVLFR